ncbi:hypothetical protein BJY04DRAFT_219659 [Aspergillus karnatakaensis]|uniref:uncharacterized protein n=1 Tax=Aspergillus karnatakaensis TaxID=1810916 RepID=UPI003CCC9BB0
MAKEKEDIFQKALRSVNPDPKAKSNTQSPPKTLAELQQRLKDVDKKFNENNRDTKVWTNLDRILAMVEITGKIIDTAVSSTVAPASLIMSSFLHLIGTARGSVASYASIGDFLGRVAGTLDRMTIHDGTIVDSILGEVLAKTVVLVSEILVVASKYLGKRRKRDIGKEFLVRLFFGECSELESKMTALQDLAQEEAMTCISLIKRDTSMLHDELQEMSTAVQKIDKNIESQRFEAKLDLETWHTMQNIHDGIQKERRAGVFAKWIVDEPLMRKWIAGETLPIVWVHGEPGIGKSFATSRLITEIVNKKKLRAYFYVRENDTATSIFKCLALQLAVRSRGFNNHALKALDLLDSVRNEVKIWENFFVPFLSKERPWRTFIVIDGLDAAASSEQSKVVDILKLFKRCTYAGKTTFRIAIISRSDLYPKMSLICRSETRYHISSDKTQSDIARYIRKRISDDRKFKDLEPSDREYAIDKLTKEAKGMFLWTSLVIGQAEEMGSRSDILKFLEDGYPKDHAHHLVRLLDSAAEKVHAPAEFKNFLQWMTCSRRPLTVSEVQYLPPSTAVNISVQSTTFSKKNLERNFKHLISLNTDTRSSRAAEIIVEFRHRSFKDHLLCEPSWTPRRLHSFTKSEAHASIFRSCLQLLQEPISEEEQAPGAAGIISYAADHILDHFKEIDVEREDLRYEHKQQFGDLVQDRVAIQRWYDAMSDKAKLTVLPSVLESPKLYQKMIYWTVGHGASAREFFRSIFVFCGEGWLQTGTVSIRTALMFLDLYDNLNEPGPQVSQSSLDDCGSVSISHLSGDRIVNLAERHDYERNASWHMRVASALREAGHIQEALKQYRDAEEEEPKNWLVKSGLSVAYAAAGDYETAVKKAQKALRCSPKPDGKCSSNIYYNISVWQEIRGEVEGQIDAAQKALTSQVALSLPLVAHYFTVLGRNLRFKTLYEFCQVLERGVRSKRGEWLMNLLCGWEEGLDLFGRAALELRTEEAVEFAEQLMKNLVNRLTGKGTSKSAVWAQYQLGRFYQRYQRDQGQARRAWENLSVVAKEYNDSKLYAQQLQCTALAELYLTGALAAQGSNQDKIKKNGEKITDDKLEKEHPDIAALRAMASGESVPNMGIEYCADAAALLGYWERKHGPKKRNKDHFRAKVCQGIQILEDEDPFNDIEGYVILGKALLLAGYTDDAKRALVTAMLFAETATTEGQSKPPFKCHGKPDCRRKTWAKLYICHICRDTTLCGDCWKAFKDRNPEDSGPPYTTCHQAHLFSNIYHEGHKVAEPVAIVDAGQLRPDTEWLNTLKRNWGITNETKAAVPITTPRVVLDSRRDLELVD